MTEAIITRYHRVEDRSVMFSDLTGIPDLQQAKLSSPQKQFVDKLPDTRVVMGLLAFLSPISGLVPRRRVAKCRRRAEGLSVIPRLLRLYAGAGGEDHPGRGKAEGRPGSL